jgi:3-methyladenine DNA glycosylase/8-oxoguanine DNA glycosylase
LHRLVHVGDEPVWIRVAQLSGDRVLFGARAATREAAESGIERMRRATGIDQDLRPFYERFAFDPVIGRAVRANPGLRAAGRPDPFEALVFAVCEQLIEYERAAEIQRRVVARMGRRWPHGGAPHLRDLPAAEVLAGTSPAFLQSLDLSAGRARALVRAAREVAAGRIDLSGPEHERSWRRLRAIPGIGPWTVEMLALNGQGRDDQLPAGDLGLRKFAGRVLSGGDPLACAEEAEVRALFAPYGRWAGLAAAHVL